jgi:hypothetical protein
MHSRRMMLSLMKTQRDFLTPGLRLVLLLPLVPTLALAIIFMAADDASPTAMVTTILILVGLVIVEQFMHAYITIRPDEVRMGFWPIFRRTIPFHEIASVETMKIDPMRDYGGWGIKGKSRSEKGMLFSAGGQHGLMITARDGRRYVATAREPLDDIAEAMLTRIRARL